MESERKNYSKYLLVKKVEVFIDSKIPEIQSQHERTKKQRRPFRYPTTLILFILFLKAGIVTYIPNLRTIHHRHGKEDFHFDHLPQNPQDIPQDFVIFLKKIE